MQHTASSNGHTRVVVQHRMLIFQRGLARELEKHYFRVDQPSSLRAWANQPGPRVLVIECHDPSDIEAAAALLAGNPELVVVGVIEEDSDDLAQAALSADVFPIVAGEEPSQLVAAIQAAVHGHLYLTKAIAKTWFDRLSTPPADLCVSDEERDWLRRLGEGWAVERLANDVGFSRSEMYRRLKALYNKLGATNQKQALVAATKQGLLTRNP